MRIPTPETDPSTLYGAIGAALGAIIALLIAFGVEVTDEQTAAILAIPAAVGPLAVALAIRLKAWAPTTHRAEVRQAADAAYARGINDVVHGNELEGAVRAEEGPDGPQV